MIRDLIGIPFVRLGRTRKGADCLGLVKLSQSEQGNPAAVDLWAWFLEQAAATDWEAVAESWGAGNIEPPPGWERIGDWPVPFAELKPGDVIEHDAITATAHVSIVAERGWILMTSSKVGSSFLLSYQDFAQRNQGAAAVWRITPDHGPTCGFTGDQPAPPDEPLTFEGEPAP